MSSTECYKSGLFDKALLRMLDCFDEVQAIMLPCYAGATTPLALPPVTHEQEL
jgi:lysyl-tRNA synthetase class I